MKKFLINNIEIKDCRLDKWLKLNFSSLNQSFIEKNLRKGNIKVNNQKKPQDNIQKKIEKKNYSNTL